MPDVPDRLQKLAEFLASYPAIDVIEGDFEDNGIWQIEFTLDGDNPDAWKVVKTLGYGFNIFAYEIDVMTFVYPAPHMTGELAVGNRILWCLRNMTPDCTPEIALDFMITVTGRELPDHFAKH